MSGFSDMLVYLRKREGLSQQELADRLGVTRSRIGMYETGKREPDFESLEAFADFFNVNMDTLMGKASTPKDECSISDEELMAAFFNGAEDLTKEEMVEMWDDARDYIQYKLAQKRRKNNG